MLMLRLMMMFKRFLGLGLGFGQVSGIWGTAKVEGAEVQRSKRVC